MSFIEILTYANSVLIVFFLLWIKFYPNNRVLQTAVRELEHSYEDMVVSFEAAIDDVYDLVDRYVAKWSNRETTRQARDREKDLKDGKDLTKRRGIIPLSDL